MIETTLNFCVAFSLSATIAVAQTQLPQPDPKFEGKIGDTPADSQPRYPQPVKAPAGSPNVLLTIGV